MRIYFDYPNATEENMKAVQDAIIAGKGMSELVEMFDEEVLWDCVVVLSGNKDTPWALLDHMNDHEQTSIEDWQFSIIDEYIGTCEHLRSLPDNDELAIKVKDIILLISRYSDGGWDHYLLDNSGNLLDEGGVYGDENTPMDEAIRGILESYQIPMHQSMTLLPNFQDLWDRALGA